MTISIDNAEKGVINPCMAQCFQSISRAEGWGNESSTCRSFHG